MKLAIILFILTTGFLHAEEMHGRSLYWDLGQVLSKISQENHNLNIALPSPFYDSKEENYCSKKLCVQGREGNASGLVYFLKDNKTYLYDLEKKSLIERKFEIDYKLGFEGLAAIYLYYKNWNGVAYSSPGGDKVKIKQKDVEKHFLGRPFEFKIVDNFMWLHVKFEVRPSYKCAPPNEQSSYSNPFKDSKVSQTVWIPYYQPVEHTEKMPAFFFEIYSNRDMSLCPPMG